MTNPAYKAALLFSVALLLGVRAWAESPAEDSAAHDAGHIRIHGHWVVEVQNPDGSVSTRREFDNSYHGDDVMALFLAGYVAPADLSITFKSASNGAGSLCAGGSGNVCVIVTSLAGGQGGTGEPWNCPSEPQYCYSGLNISLTPGAGGSGSAAMVLSAHITAALSGTFDTVDTDTFYCSQGGTDGASTPIAPSTISSKDCFDGDYDGWFYWSDFTSTTLTSAVSVTAGQVLLFQVTLSFS